MFPFIVTILFICSKCKIFLIFVKLNIIEINL